MTISAMMRWCGVATLLGWAAAASSAVDIFVDPTRGSDTATGSAAHPIASLLKARALVAHHAGVGTEVTVHLAAGARFELARPAQGGGGLNLSSVDSGTVRWVGEGAAGATVSGAVFLDHWTKKANLNHDDEDPGAAGVVATACNASDPTQQGWAYDAAAGHITRGGLCLSADTWGLSVHLFSCGERPPSAPPKIINTLSHLHPSLHRLPLNPAPPRAIRPPLSAAFH